MRTLKALLITAAIGLPFAALAQSVTTTEQTAVKPHTSGTAAGLPGVASPRATNTIVPVQKDSVMKSDNAGSAEGGSGGSGGK